MLSLLLWFTARDPVRNVAILDALIAGLCILSVTPLLSLWMTESAVFIRRTLFGDDPWCGSP